MVYGKRLTRFVSVGPLTDCEESQRLRTERDAALKALEKASPRVDKDQLAVLRSKASVAKQEYEKHRRQHGC
jgi:hypothetical protein